MSGSLDSRFRAVMDRISGRVEERLGALTTDQPELRQEAGIEELHASYREAGFGFPHEELTALVRGLADETLNESSRDMLDAIARGVPPHVVLNAGISATCEAVLVAAYVMGREDAREEGTDGR